MSVGWSDGHSLDPWCGGEKLPDKKSSGLKYAQEGGTSPQGELSDFCWKAPGMSLGHFRGSLVGFVLFSAASHIRAVEAVLAHQKGWKPSGVTVTFPRGQGWGFCSWANCGREDNGHDKNTILPPQGLPLVILLSYLAQYLACSLQCWLLTPFVSCISKVLPGEDQKVKITHWLLVSKAQRNWKSESNHREPDSSQLWGFVVGWCFIGGKDVAPLSPQHYLLCMHGDCGTSSGGVNVTKDIQISHQLFSAEL